MGGMDNDELLLELNDDLFWIDEEELCLCIMNQIPFVPEL